MNEFKRTGVRSFFAVLILALVSGTAFSQTFPPLDPLVDQRKYMNLYLELEAQATSRSFMSMSERERAEAILTLMYEKKLWKYQKNQTKLTTLLEYGTYNCVSASVLYSALAKAAGLAPTVMGEQLTQAQLSRLAEALSAWSLPVTGTQGFDQAQVTAGGASLKDFDVRRMQSLRGKGLFAAGEVLDVDGDCGGFNLHWAWASACAAATAMSARLGKE